jgi:hypothetical protein
MRPKLTTRYAICLRSKDADDLVVRRVYAIIPDVQAEREKYVRVIDESGEDYLYPASYFFEVKLPARVERALRRTLPAQPS